MGGSGDFHSPFDIFESFFGGAFSGEDVNLLSSIFQSAQM